jgi:glycine cleavage system regulatory protein
VIGYAGIDPQFRSSILRASIQPMKITLVGSRYFGATVFDALVNDGVDIVQVVAPAADDRLALAAQAQGVRVHVLGNPRLVPGDAIPDGTDLIVAAHTHARVSDEALARSRLRGIGYHPSLLPRHRGIAAVEWTILEGDAIAGGSVYHLAAGWDAGAIAAQDWCFVAKGETARELWERALAPLGLALLTRVVRHAAEHGELPAHPQDERFATKAPMIRRTISLSEEGKAVGTSLIVTAIGADRPGIVSLLSDRAQGFGANWAGSRMANLAGQFAGMVHFEVPAPNAEPLAQALRSLETSGLRVVIEKVETPPAPAGRRIVRLELTGLDRPGIVRDLSRSLAEQGVSIDDLHTEIVDGNTSAEHLFKVKALLVVPESLPNEKLREALSALANELMVDIALGEAAAKDAG